MDTKNENKNTSDLDTIIAYVQLVNYTLNKSKIEMNAKNIKSEVKMFYERFGDTEVKRLANLIIKEKK